MPSPFPGMDPYLEKGGIFHELHSQMLGEIQGQLQPQLRPKYLAKLERHLSEGSVWDAPASGLISLARKAPDLTITASLPAPGERESTTVLAIPVASLTEELGEDELQLRWQRRIVIYVQATQRLTVTTIELLSPSNKDAGTVGQARYLEKRGSALHGGLHWVEIDLLRAGQRPPQPIALPHPTSYLAYVAQATPTGWNHLAYPWGLRDPLPILPIPLLGSDRVFLNLGPCFRVAYDRTGADAEADYPGPPPSPPLSPDDSTWADALLRQHGLRS